MAPPAGVSGHHEGEPDAAQEHEVGSPEGAEQSAEEDCKLVFANITALGKKSWSCLSRSYIMQQCQYMGLVETPRARERAHSQRAGSRVEVHRQLGARRGPRQVRGRSRASDRGREGGGGRPSCLATIGAFDVSLSGRGTSQLTAERGLIRSTVFYLPVFIREDAVVLRS